jgi:hypothetical protein
MIGNEKCQCNNPYRNYGEKICLNCGGIIDFESERIEKL